jgi:hypothetical protein
MLSIEVSWSERHFVEQSQYGLNSVRDTTVIRKQVWGPDAGIYSGKSCEPKLQACQAVDQYLQSAPDQLTAKREH